MEFDINRYIEKKNKHSIKRCLKYYWKKYQHYCKIQYSKIESQNTNNEKDNILCFLLLFTLLSVFIICKPLRLELLNTFKPILDIVISILFYIIPVISVIIFIWLAMAACEIEKKIDYNLKGSKMINFKKGFNRINVILAIIFTLIFMVFYGLVQYGNYNFVIENLDKTKQLNEFVKHLTSFIFYTFIFYSVFRILYLTFVKIIDWFIKGFKND